MQLTKFLDILLKGTSSGTIKWNEVGGHAKFMTVESSANLTTVKPVRFGTQEITVILQRLDRLVLVLKCEGKDQLVLPLHQQSNVGTYSIKLFDAIMEAQIDADFFGTPPAIKKVSKPVNS